MQGLAQDVENWKTDTKIELESLKKDVENILEEMQVSSSESDKIVKEMKAIEVKVENSLAKRLDEQIVKVKSELDIKVDAVKQNQLVSKTKHESDLKTLQNSFGVRMSTFANDSKIQFDELKKKVDHDMDAVQQDQLVSKTKQESDLKTLGVKMNTVANDSKVQVEELKKKVDHDMEQLKSDLSK